MFSSKLGVMSSAGSSSQGTRKAATANRRFAKPGQETVRGTLAEVRETVDEELGTYRDLPPSKPTGPAYH